MTTFETLTLAMSQIEASKRVVICPPDQAEAVQALIAERGLDGLWTVRSSYLCPRDRFYLLDDDALRSAIFDGIENGPGIISFSPKEQP